MLTLIAAQHAVCASVTKEDCSLVTLPDRGWKIVDFKRGKETERWKQDREEGWRRSKKKCGQSGRLDCKRDSTSRFTR